MVAVETTCSSVQSFNYLKTLSYDGTVLTNTIWSVAIETFFTVAPIRANSVHTATVASTLVISVGALVIV